MTGPEVAEAHAQFLGDDLGERGLAEPRRPVQQHVVERFAARLRRLDEHPQILADLFLADEFVECERADMPLRPVLGQRFARHVAGRRFLAHRANSRKASGTSACTLASSPSFFTALLVAATASARR
jgi:hypothetical protein